MIEIKATVVAVSNMLGKAAKIDFTRKDGTLGQAWVNSEGWLGFWPPQPGDEIKIEMQPRITLTGRPNDPRTP